MSDYTNDVSAMKEAMDNVVDVRQAIEEICKVFKELCDFLARNEIKILETYFLWLGVPRRCVFLAFRSKKRRIRKKNMRRCLALLASAV